MALNYSFTGKKVLVTGGGSGIGRQLVQRFHDDGATVYTVDKSPESIRKLQEALPNVKAEVVDMTDWQATRKVVESFGPIDHLVNNAAVLIPQKFMEITEDTAALHYHTNVGAVINVTQTVAKAMIASGNGGTVVNLSSLAARKSSSAVACYAASKAALEMLTKTMSVELGPHKIRVNCILPGLVDAPMANNLGSDTKERIERIKQKLLVEKRAIETNEIADLVLFLLSPLSSMIVGQAVVIDGGLSL